MEQLIKRKGDGDGGDAKRSRTNPNALTIVDPNNNQLVVADEVSIFLFWLRWRVSPR
jgi:hypothetical protein